jgi:uncharacterized protein YbjT (DUF2867 family)
MNRHEELAMHAQDIVLNASHGITLVIGGTGKTGRRVAERLQAMGRRTRIGSRRGDPAFDWHDPASWSAALAGVTAVYITFVPDLAVAGSKDAIDAFSKLAVASGVQRLVLLSGRGEAEALACERIVQEAGAAWTIVRAGWFSQNFSEGEFLGMVKDGTIRLPARDIPEPFIDVEDIADVAVAALTQDGHEYEIYEVTGPRLMTFTDAAREISQAIGREVKFEQIPQAAFNEAIRDSGAPKEYAWLLNYLFETVLDGRNAYLGDGVQRALGRPPRDFSAFAREVARSGAWDGMESKSAA